MSTLVTGAGGAIGGEIVRQLLAAGTLVIAQDIDADRLAPLQGNEAATITTGDLLSTQYQQELRDLAGGSQVDSVIAAHGIDGSGSLEALSNDFLRRVITVNAQAVSALLDATLPALRRSGGTFVVIASQAGLQAEPNNVAYCTAKFAIVGWVTRLAPTLARESVSIRAFCPGCTETPLLFAAQERFAVAQGISPDVFVQQRRHKIPIQRFAHVSETAAGTIYLAAPAGRRPVILAATGGEVLT